MRSAARNAVRISSPISRGPFCPVPLLISSFRGREAGNIVIARDDTAILRMCWREADNMSPGIAGRPWRYFIERGSSASRPLFRSRIAEACDKGSSAGCGRTNLRVFAKRGARRRLAATTCVVPKRRLKANLGFAWQSYWIVRRHI